jgi:hypothetical protein
LKERSTGPGDLYKDSIDDQLQKRNEAQLKIVCGKRGAINEKKKDKG